MANTVNLDKITEYQDSREEEEVKIRGLATMIRNAKHLIIFTGAGISTSANIPDFRGPNGVWTCQAKGVTAPEGVPLVQAVPTECHKFLKQLVDQGKCKFIVSQNIDGLHRRSGVSPGKLSELHGNCFLEVCWQCGASYDHEVEVHGSGQNNKNCEECKSRVPHFCHCTGNKCAACGGRLKDSIIHFQENLPPQAIRDAMTQAKKADACIVLGSSLTVSPACDIPKIVAKRGGQLAIVNMQETPLDHLATLRLYSKTDEVSTGVANALAELGDDDTTSASSGGDVSSAPETVAAVRSSAPPVPVAASLSVGNTHEMLDTVSEGGENAHLWRMEVRSPDGTPDLMKVASVTYTLHPTFTPNVVAVFASEANPTCRLSRKGWGTFQVGVLVNLRSGRQVRVKHDLCFANGGSFTTVDL